MSATSVSQNLAIENPSFLVIDDHMLMRKLVTQQLNSAGYTKIQDAKTGAEGLEKIDQAISAGMPYDIVFVDWGMPEMDGITFLRQCRAREELNQTAFVMLTGESERKSVMEAIAAGATAYIIKPVSGEELIEKVTKIKDWLKKKRGI
jgi:two-component system, chemotaxis family, chemotaxis protein CheY